MGLGPGGVPIGAEEQVYVVSESAYNTYTRPVGSDAITVLKSVFTVAQPRTDRMDKRNTRSRTGRITGKKEVDWSLSMYLLLSGTAGTASDAQLLWEACMGLGTNTPATSQVYTLIKSFDKSLSIHRQYGHVSESIMGAFVDQIEITISGTDAMKIDFSGKASTTTFAGYGTLSASAASGATTVSVANASKLYGANAMIQVGSDTNAGAGILIGSVSGTTITLSDPLTASAASGAVVQGYMPTPVVTGNPMPATVGSVTFDATEVKITEGKITIKNNMNLRNDEFGQEYATDYSATSRREVSYSFSGKARKGYGRWVGASRDFDDIAVVFTAGDTAGSIFTVSLPECEMDVVSFDVPEEAEVGLTLAGIAKDTSAAEGEITVSET